MKPVGKIAVGFAVGVALCAITRADNDPYGSIVRRNIFALNAPVIPNPNQNAPPPPTITATGIMTIFGATQVLYKVTGNTEPRQSPAKEQSYILSVGERQDDIEVVKIDEEGEIVTFNNHGVTQLIPLTKGSSQSGPMPTLPNFQPGVPTALSGGGYGGAVPNLIFGGARGAMQAFGNNGNGTGVNAAPAWGPPPPPNTAQQSALSPEGQIIMIAAQKAQAKSAGNPIWKIYPPTELDEDAGTVNSSSPGGPSSP